MQSKAVNVAIIIAAQILALALWFSGTAAGPGMAREAPTVTASFQAMLTGAVQAGFVLGTLICAILSLPDRFDPRRLFAASAIIGALANATILFLPPGEPAMLVARLITGMCLAGVYPVGMKLAIGWADRGDAGLLVGLLVAGLTLGSASPHLVNSFGAMPWRVALATASGSAIFAAVLITLVQLGPRHGRAARFRPGAVLELWRRRGWRLVTTGYLGHMWELYAMWAWVGAYLQASFAAWRGGEAAPAPFLTFLIIAAGAAGSVAAGFLADRFGRVPVTVTAMLISGTCCLLAGLAFGLHPAWTVLLCLVWGVAVVADSAQFSASAAELSEPALVGTVLMMQTCLGFALTIVTIQLMPFLVAWLGWGGSFAVLAAGPLLGAWAMLRLGPQAGVTPAHS